MYLGIDIGTSAVKLVCTDTDRILATSSVGIDTSSPRPGWSEQHPDLWWDATRDALNQLSGQVTLSGVKAIGLSGQMHGAVLLDHNLRPIRPAILWNDSRSARECDELRAVQPKIGQIAGVLPLPGFTAPKISWLKQNEPEHYSRLAHMLLPKDYVGLCLHGELATDTSDAAGTLWLDQAARNWHVGITEATGVLPSWLPPIFNGTDVVGSVTAQAAAMTGLKEGVPVVAGGGDAATGAVSLGATEPGRGFISLGTSGQLFVADREYKPNPERYVHAFAHTLPGRWYQMAAMLNGARPISWIGGQLGLSAAEVVALAETASGERLPIFLPYLTGERSPLGDPHIRASFFGLEDSTTRAEICRSVVEAIAFCFADAAQSFGDTIDSLPELAAIGGGSQSDLLLRLIATVTGKPIVRSQGSDSGPAFGAARLAACGVGALQEADLAVQPSTTDRFEPDEMAALSERLQRFRRLYKAVSVVD
ncbi:MULTISPECIES: xylulokinase [unclassified Ruegeria]|uniref:xylulokinase n=1 Tax=unclassified Ruegeria TaxID=2625375 RepID=UPI0014876707|nr:MULTISPECIES: xylulokinase [unclassified Ruegeria]NOD77676.1 xylulokinase [Ruegeria sp. HKCCD4332]NOD89883.1 xylulokinase [Ruegeria sp. HKCCD4318]NOE14671.1 xylulokinase [Ruegeria sp. HKCCD4318-2]NOG10975.1 xylulokinase [Ruegeria sp. HKCCD4315]